MNYSIRQAQTEDTTEIEQLLPRLADFELPSHRKPEHLWHGDRDLVRSWAAGERPDVKVIVASGAGSSREEAIYGVAIVSIGKELLSGVRSAHLEVLAIAANAEGAGIGTALLEETDAIARNSGAQCISLHVFTSNNRARSLYERQGYKGELMRYLKPLT